MEEKMNQDQIESDEKMDQDQIKTQEFIEKIEKDVLARLEEELKELEDKVYKLHDALYTDKKFVTVRPMQGILMKKQYDVMCEYQRILRRRIKHLSISLGIDDDSSDECEENC